jgi:hypothetical protein
MNLTSVSAADQNSVGLCQRCEFRTLVKLPGLAPSRQHRHFASENTESCYPLLVATPKGSLSPLTILNLLKYNIRA